VADEVSGTERIEVPLGFDVPDGWTAVDPATLGARAAFVLVRPSPDEDYNPSITIGIDRRADGADISASADESIDRIAAAVAEVELVDRQPIGDQRAPGITQVLRLRIAAGPGGPARKLVQTQVHLAIPLGDTAADRLVVEIACTCLPTQTATVIPQFQRLVGTFHIRDDAATPTGR
jgi:hypothetical protein